LKEIFAYHVEDDLSYTITLLFTKNTESLNAYNSLTNQTSVDKNDTLDVGQKLLELYILFWPNRLCILFD